MILRLFGLLFAAGALVLGLFGGWGWRFGEMISQVNPRALRTVHDGVSTTLPSGIWDSLFGPVLNLPAWVIPLGIAVILFAVAAFQPGKA